MSRISSLFDLTGKHVLIVGSGNVPAAIAVRFRDAGASVTHVAEPGRSIKLHGRGGRLIKISTIGSEHPALHGNYAYGASRAGTNALTRQFALDFAKDRILSNAILVGAVPSDAFPEGVAAPSGPGADPKRLLCGLGNPEDVAPTALLLATEAGRYINGQTITVDGGFSVS